MPTCFTSRGKSFRRKSPEKRAPSSEGPSNSIPTAARPFTGPWRNPRPMKRSPSFPWPFPAFPRRNCLPTSRIPPRSVPPSWGSPFPCEKTSSLKGISPAPPATKRIFPCCFPGPGCPISRPFSFPPGRPWRPFGKRSNTETEKFSKPSSIPRRVRPSANAS